MQVRQKEDLRIVPEQVVESPDAKWGVRMEIISGFFQEILSIGIRRDE